MKIIWMALHPILFSIYPVLFLYSHNISILPIQGILIPLFVISLSAFSFWLVLGLVLKNGAKAGFIVSLIMFMFFFYNHIINFVTFSHNVVGLGDIRSPIIQTFIVIFLILLAVGIYYFVRTKRKLDKPTLIANAIAVVLIAMVLMNIGSNRIETYYSEENNLSIQNFEQLSINEKLPDIYYFLLDGYANHMILKETLGYDNQQFINFLTERGFIVPSNYTHSNYEFTASSIPSILGMDFVNNLVPYNNNSEQWTEAVYDTIDNNSVMRNFNSIGYTTISFDSGWFGTRTIKIVDENLCANPTVDWRFLKMLKSTTMLPFIEIIDEIISDFIHAQKREQILCEFSEVHKIKDRMEGPFMAFIHIVAPHPHFVFDSNGEPTYANVDKLSKIEERKAGYIGQLKFINKKMEEVVDKVLTNTNDPTIIIIQSDHGTRIVDDGRTWNEEQIIRFGNLNAFYVPDEMQDLFYNPTTPVNTFRLLFNGIFDSSYEILDDKVFKAKKIIQDWEKIKNTVIEKYQT